MYPQQQPATPPLQPKSHTTAFIIAATLAVLFLGTTFWAFLGKSAAESDLQEQISAAVAQREASLAEELQNQFDEELKQDTRPANFLESLGTITINYPKIWSVYAEETPSSNRLLDLYAQPGVVPDVDSEAAFTFRMQVHDEDYEDVISDLADRVEDGELRARPYRSNGVLGTVYNGTLPNDKTGRLVVLPLRDKTLSLWTEVSTASSELEAILETLKFSP